MQQVNVKNFAEWRDAARKLLAAEVHPDEVVWGESLFRNADPELVSGSHEKIPNQVRDMRVSKEFVALAEKLSCHADDRKWNILYTALWRLAHGEKFLLKLSADLLVREMQIMNKQISFEAHKTKAFVRFRLMEDGHYIAWHNPTHFVLPLVAPFFSRRFNDMHWTILTPHQSVSWDGEELTWGEGVPASEAPAPDKLEDMWKTYYRATFNPARIKIKAMKKEMPVRHWPTLPETEIIHELLGEAPKRVEKMIQDAAKNLG